jgi:hypothetical protein
MRIWDIDPKRLCRKHLLGEHRELHALYSILLHNKKGYRFHPETLRWVNKLPALFSRHELLVLEMQRRGYTHSSPLEESIGQTSQEELLHTLEEQEKILQEKNCDCLLSA